MAHDFTNAFLRADDEMRPEDHIDDHRGPILMAGGLAPWRGDLMLEPIDHGFALHFVCGGCGQKWTAAIDFDEMEVSE